MAFSVVAFGKNVPPAPPSVQVPPVAPPPTEPPNGVVVPPRHIAAIAPPAFAVGKEFTVIVRVEVFLQPVAVFVPVTV